jgi:hypothetical protein
MAETNFTIERDLKEAQAMADALVPYVHEKQLYGQVGGGGLFGAGNMPSLTLGALLMRIERLRHFESAMTPQQRETFAAVQHGLAETRREWRQHYIDKLNQEAMSRLKAMNQFFEECAENIANCARAYLPEALRRTVVQAIIHEMEALDLPTEAVVREARSQDSRLRRYAEPDAFVWSPELAAAYPQTQYWWLYARPHAPQKQR